MTAKSGGLPVRTEPKKERSNVVLFQLHLRLVGLQTTEHFHVLIVSDKGFCFRRHDWGLVWFGIIQLGNGVVKETKLFFCDRVESVSARRKGGRFFGRCRPWGEASARIVVLS